MTHIKDAKPEPLTADQEAWHRRAALCGDVPNHLIILACFATLDAARRERDEARADQALLDRVLAAVGIADSHLDPGDYVEALLAELDASRAETEAVRRERDEAHEAFIEESTDLVNVAAEREALRSLAAELVEAIEAAGGMPEGFCCCSENRIGDDSKIHQPECRDVRAALARARAQGIGGEKAGE